MEKFDLYRDIQARTGGEIYVGIVGPVRTGKSTFIRKFMEQLVLPVLPEQERERATDELPASATGKIVTTVEPKFIPREAVTVPVGEGAEMRIRMVDCVGFPVPGAEGMEENGAPRMVHTPWSETPMSFQEAARTGTRKVIHEHATVGIVITTDGSFGDLPRQSFLKAEKETIEELQAIGKPFLLLINSASPEGKEAKETAAYMKNTYGRKSLVLNCEKLKKEDINNIFEQLLMEFPVTKVAFQIPRWMETLECSHWLKQELFRAVQESMQKLRIVRDLFHSDFLVPGDHIKKAKLEHADLSTGSAEVSLQVEDSLYYRILSEMTGTEIKSEYQLISMIREMAGLKKEYESVADAITEVKQKGYGMITPARDEIHLEEPVLIHQGNKYGVKIKAVSPSIHLIRAEIETELSPIVGSESQAQDLITYIRTNSETQEGAWNTLIFGKSMAQMVDDGIRAKLSVIGEDTQQKLQNTMKRIVNSSGGRLICIII
ncbi:MAG: stage IV sporulation protein A [Lachnospiraceae bacterium]|nr:stage IV sporulation protein A [Lachnospiraceae bacterium]